MSNDAIDILALRDSIGWTQDRMAAYLGCDRSTVSRMENGQEQSGPIKRLLATLKGAAEKGVIDVLFPDPSQASSEVA